MFRRQMSDIITDSNWSYYSFTDSNADYNQGVN